VGIVASLRVGGAVARNRAKRRLREALMRVELKSDTAYVVVASPNVVTMRFDDLVGELGTAITASGEEENR
jgi:ribonuclease P protein component